MRIWLKSSVLFEVKPDGTEVLNDGGRLRIDSAMSTYLKYLPSNPTSLKATLQRRPWLSSSSFHGDARHWSVRMC